jgi:hypothetical protein
MSTINNEEIKTIDRRAYQRGYAAGRKLNRQKQEREKKRLWNQALLRCLPWALESKGWTRSGEPITGLAERVRLAADAADEAVKQAGKR